MNINNIFAGILGFIIAMAITYLTWSPINDFLSAIEITELRIFLQVSYVIFVVICCVIVPINLATSDDSGE